MLNLSGDDRKQLRQAILSAYPDPGDLTIFVDEALNKNLAAIADGGNLSQIAFNLIRWAEAKGYIEQLILALPKDTENPDIQRFCGRVLQQHLRLNPTASSALSSPLAFEQTDWDLDISDEDLQFFLPKQFSVEADVGQLRRGLELANSVCKITFADRSAEESGTGVLIAPDLVLTNYHVLSLEPDADLNAIARSARFQFGHISNELGKAAGVQILTTVESKAVESSSPIDELDYALLRLNLDGDVSIEPVPLDTASQLTPKSPLNILQHPEGEMMKVSLSNNGVVKTNDARGLVLYVNSTKGGSSGSPCFNHEWKLVALHHKELATSFGSVREGILLSAIYQQISSVL